MVDRITFRIASCQTDEEFETALNKYLPMVVLKLSSPSEGVRTRVMELLVHVNKRLKTRPNISLPVKQLLLQYQDPSATSFVINFTIIYLKMGIPRLPTAEKVELLPTILRSLERKPQSHQDALMMHVISVLPHFDVPSSPEQRAIMLSLDDEKIAKTFLDFTFDVLLLPYGPVPQPAAGAANSAAQPPPPPPSPPCMSPASYKRVTCESPLKPESLEPVKVAIIKILTNGPFQPNAILPHLAIASSDTHHSVATAGDSELRRLTSSINWEDKQTMVKLYDMILGTIVCKNDPKKSTVKLEDRKTAANTRIRLKLVPLLTRSTIACTLIIPAVQTITDCLNGAETKANLRTRALQFAMHFTKNCPDNLFAAIAPLLYREVRKVAFKLPEAGEDCAFFASLKKMALTIMPQIVIRQTILLKKDSALLSTLLESLTAIQENPGSQELKFVVKTMLFELVSAFKQVSCREDCDE